MNSYRQAVFYYYYYYYYYNYYTSLLVHSTSYRQAVLRGYRPGKLGDVNDPFFVAADASLRYVKRQPAAFDKHQ